MNFYFFEFDEYEDDDEEIPMEWYRSFLVESDRYPEELKILIDGSYWDLEAPPYIIKSLVIKKCV